MSMKRATGGGARKAVDESATKIDRQHLWDELQKRAEANEPFAPVELAQAMGMPEAAISRVLLTLAFERVIDKVDANKYRPGPVANISQADFNKAMAAKIDPRRQQDQLEIERLKKNNEEMRRRLLDASAERDKFLQLISAISGLKLGIVDELAAALTDEERTQLADGRVVLRIVDRSQPADVFFRLPTEPVYVTAPVTAISEQQWRATVVLVLDELGHGPPIPK